jgi:hypothetical protein
MTPSARNAMRSRRSVFLNTRLDGAPATIKYFVFSDFLSRVPSWRMLRFSILLRYTRQAEATLHGDRAFRRCGQAGVISLSVKGLHPPHSPNSDRSD